MGPGGSREAPVNNGMPAFPTTFHPLIGKSVLLLQRVSSFFDERKMRS